ncbi:hypothetical protein [Pseudoroseomonas ludipueritiae]|uniref:HNH endonuclease n=1 Tax=Pseudoroseomonas ludipueritiae TaxID=198093 RepID=A0ABR7RCB4_9PROT|nr:hypothetical protein [Pseudoroseomonas ludipueritiae]MBC9179482.1 hypothetical protein [Pseudoroseomonas ludipueritiae]
MAKTCIICGEKAGSREHVFPAALGGRRTDKGIYCPEHNLAYSGLANVIKTQLAVFNARLGVVGDHADLPTHVVVTDVASGLPLELSIAGSNFASPREVSSEFVDGEIRKVISFRSHKEAEVWTAEMRKKGFKVSVRSVGEKQTYFLGATRGGFMLGDAEGMRAVAYIAQTFFAQAYPEVIRRPEFQTLKDYTLDGQGSGFVGWDIDPPLTLAPIGFPFGHRVIVGHSGVNGVAYARLSFFSTLNFVVFLGRSKTERCSSVLTDINPLERRPPRDIEVQRLNEAVGAVPFPDAPMPTLQELGGKGALLAQVQGLFRQIDDFVADEAVAKIMARVDDAGALGDDKRLALCQDIFSDEGQRVLLLMDMASNHAKEQAAVQTLELELRALAVFLEQRVQRDPEAANGLSAEATRSLAVAQEALARQMSEDWKSGTLGRARMRALLIDGTGAYIVGNAIFKAGENEYFQTLKAVAQDLLNSLRRGAAGP